MPISLGLSLLITSALAPQVAPAAQSYLPQAQTIREYVTEYFADAPVMISIAQCESHFRQFDKTGSIHRGKINRSDLGVMQINEYYHGEKAEKLGLDLYTIEGNLEFARYLYEKEGTTPWLSSSKCWKKNNHVAMTVSKDRP